jgi:hypothetical protein
VQSWRRHEARAGHRAVTGQNGRPQAAPARSLAARSQVVVDVHTQQALSTAELLLEQGWRVGVVSPLFYVGQDIG